VRNEQEDELATFIDALYRPTDPTRQKGFFPVAEKPSNLDTLAQQLDACTTVTDLFKLASSDAFRAGAATLNESEVKTLRGVYHARQQSLDGAIKMDQLDGQTVNVVSIDWWQSDYGDGVTLTVHPEREPDKTYKTRTSSAPVVNFARRLRETPTEKAPVRALFQLVPVSDPERAKLGQKRWNVRRLPPAAQGLEGGVPF